MGHKSACSRRKGIRRSVSHGSQCHTDSKVTVRVRLALPNGVGGVIRSVECLCGCCVMAHDVIVTWLCSHQTGLLAGFMSNVSRSRCTRLFKISKDDHHKACHGTR